MDRTVRIHQPSDDLLNLGEWLPIPNAYVDQLIADLGVISFCILLVIKRQTHGFQKHRDRISLSQLVRLTGLSENTIKTHLNRLIEAGHVERTADATPKQAYEYCLNEGLKMKLRVSGNDTQGIKRLPPEYQEMIPRVSADDTTKDIPKDITKDISKELARDFLLCLETRFDKSTWRDLSGLEVKDITDESLTLVFKNKYQREFTQERRAKIVEQAAEAAFGRPMAVRYEERG